MVQIQLASGSSVHKPVLSSCASWNTSEMIIANNDATDWCIFSNTFFVDINDTLYITNPTKKTIQVLPKKQGLINKTINTNSTFSIGLFVPNTGGIYLDRGNDSFITRWSDLGSSPVMQINRGCRSLFISTGNILYCSISNGHQVIKMPLNSNVSLLTTAAGTGCPGSASDMLKQPLGIYVDVNFDLYVADTGNNRIQLFHDGDLNGATVAGNDATNTLNEPTSVILDADNYLYVVDYGNQRIIRTRNGIFQCIIGCTGRLCSQPDQLCYPFTAIFDSLGNIYVNNMIGIQKYILATDSCVPSTIQTTEEPTTESIINQTCFPPNITIFPGPSTYEIPRQFRRSQDFYITAIIKVLCAESSLTEMKWSIFNCTPNCSVPANIDPSMNISLRELFFPEKSLPYGLYQFKLTVKMVAVPKRISSESAFVRITPSGITANLVKLGTSIVTSGENRELLLDPGEYSIDPDENAFNASDWLYAYQCRVYDTGYITSWTPIDDPNHPCFSNRKDNTPVLQYNPRNASGSSVTILPGSLKYNHSYQFTVSMTNRRNLTSQATGYVIVNVDNSRPQMVAVACVISTMCSLNQEYQRINPSTQVALFSSCVVTCNSILKINWKIYQGYNDSSTGIVKWNSYTSSNLYFYGMNTSNFTALNTLFTDNERILYWRFEVTYTFVGVMSTSALNFIINQRPDNGSCTIDPTNGTTSTLFTINCTGWLDEDEIKDYSFYRRISPTEQVMLAFSMYPTLEIQLPAGDDITSTVNITVQIRDVLNCVQEFDMDPVIVTLNPTAIDTLIDAIRNPSSGSSNNPVIQALTSGNQNAVGQVVTVLSQEFNKRNKQSLDMAVANGTPAASISVSPLDSKPTSEPSGSKNGSIKPDYVQKLTNLANIRDYLMKVSTDLALGTNIDIIKLQANTLAQLTEATSELTRPAALLASTRCYELAKRLKQISMRVSYEDAQFASNKIALCTNNALTAINAPLQQRGVLLNITSSDEDIDYVDYDSDPELFQLTIRLMTNGEEMSSETAKRERSFYYQKKTANQIAQQAAETVALITSVLDIHLNIGQNLSLNSASLLVSLETTTIESLYNKTFKQAGNGQIRMPLNVQSNLSPNASISVRSTMQPLAPLGASPLQANTNMSTTISLTVMDQDGKEIPIQATDDQPIEFFIPRDPNLVLPDMRLQNITSKTSEDSFNLSLNQFVINKNLTVSVHFEVRPLNISLGYLFIYQFDKTPQLNSGKNDIDDWDLFCPTNKSIYKYYINNRKTAGHQSVVYKLRELNSTEIIKFCPKKSNDNPPIFDEPANFTSNYELRIYSSGCYYLDQYNNWQSDSLWVGPSTDHYQTQCFTTRLTTFTKT